MSYKSNAILLSLIILVFPSPVPLASTQIPLDLLIANLPEPVAVGLDSDGVVYRHDRSGIGMALAPDHSTLNAVKQLNSRIAPDVIVEGLYLIPYPQGVDGIDLHLYNTTRRVSGITEILYPSARKKALVPLFDKVYRIDDIRTKKRLDDPLVNTIPRFDSVLIYMKEVVLGAGYYELQYAYDGENLGFSVNNVSTLRPLIKIADKGNLAINIIIFPTDKGYLTYGYCGVKLANRKLVLRIMDPYSAFYKRLYSLIIWVENSLHGIDKQPVIGNSLDF